MATTNTGSERVLVINYHRGTIDSVSDERRSVYENTKGRFIKTVNHGQVWLDECNRAVIATRRINDSTGRWRLTEYYTPTEVEIENALHALFSDFNLEGFIK